MKPKSNYQIIQRDKHTIHDEVFSGTQQATTLDRINQALDNFSIVTITDDAGKIIYANEMFCKTSKYTKKELLGTNTRILKSGFHLDDFYKEMWSTISKGKVWQDNVKNRAKDGTFYWVKTIIVPILDSNKKPETYISIQTDITKQKNIEEKLSNAIQVLSTAKRYRDLYEQSPDLFRTIDTKGIIVDCNKSYAQSLGRTKKEIIGTSIFKNLNKRCAIRMKKIFEEWREKHFVVNKKVFMVRKNGTVFPALLSANSIYDDNGKVIGSNTIIRDISELHAAKEKIKNQLEALKKIDKEKDEFTAMITHELKTPLVPIVGYVDILLSESLGVLNEAQKRRLHLIKSSASLLTNTISEFLDIQKIEMGKSVLKTQRWNISDMVNHVIEIMTPETSVHNIKINSNIQGGIYCICDKNRMIKVLSNIIMNSIDFCPKQDGLIKIILKKEKNYVRFSIIDNGTGIPQDKINSIFKKFYQVDTSNTRKHGGTGLGLSICKGIIQSHKGKIWAQSQLGQGTTINIEIPCK